ncbi:MAG: glycosyltransferase family 4 protein [Candidatus Glassbacteria bacterium]|nr:glycosyltransferase family 4 protein [Candidatus Glassbacteria bacterium]
MSASVLVLTNAYPDYEGSYHGIFVRRTAEELGSLGWHSRILVPRVFPQSLSTESFPSHSVGRFPFPSAGKLLIEYPDVPVFRISCLLVSGLWTALRTVRAQDCRLIHAHWAFPAGLIGLAAARLTGKPLMLTVHGSDWRMAAGRGGAIRKAFLAVAGASGRIISVSPEITGWMTDNGIDRAKIFTRPVGVDLNVFGGDKTTDLDNRPEGSVVSTRNLTEPYRVGDLVGAAAILKDRTPSLSLRLAGDGALKEELERKAKRCGLDRAVSFCGRLSQELLAEILGKSRVYVSTSPVEGTSISLLEAMASGCLPVVTDIPANRDWITHGENGLLFPPGDIDLLASCLERALRDKPLERRAHESGKNTVRERGDFAAHVALTDRLYRELL